MGEELTQDSDIEGRWKEYLVQLLNSDEIRGEDWRERERERTITIGIWQPCPIQTIPVGKAFRKYSPKGDFPPLQYERDLYGGEGCWGMEE